MSVYFCGVVNCEMQVAYLAVSNFQQPDDFFQAIYAVGLHNHVGYYYNSVDVACISKAASSVVILVTIGIFLKPLFKSQHVPLLF